MGRVLRHLLHALVLWVMMRGLVSLAVSSGTQSLWALAAATTATVAIAALITTWLSRSHRSGIGALSRLLIPVPVLGGVWAGISTWNQQASGQQVAVAAGAWLVGGLLGVILARLVWRRRHRRTPDMRTSFA